MKGILFLFVILSVALCDSAYEVKKIQDPSAKCLDGTQGVYYISNGSGLNKTKFLFYFEGGGWCGSRDLNKTLQSCYDRSKTDRGSSLTDVKNKTMNSGGPLSGNSSVNRLFYDWNRVIVRYCDGTGHQGSKAQPVDYNGTKLYFRGANITISRFEEIHKGYGLWNATDIVLTGCSAGSLAAFTWVNYVKSKTTARVVAIPDSGLFLDEPNIYTTKYEYRERIKNFMAFSNVQTDPPIPECVAAYPTEKWRCLFAQYQYPFIKTPLFVVNSLYDAWSLEGILGLKCLGTDDSLAPCTDYQKAAAEEYKNKMVQTLNNITKNGTKNGAWAPACPRHCYSIKLWNQPKLAAVPLGSKWTIQYSVDQWRRYPNNNTYNTHIDSVSWPNNTGCAVTTV